MSTREESICCREVNRVDLKIQESEVQLSCTVVTQMTGSAHRTYTKLIKYALRITSLQSGRVKYTIFSSYFTIDFLWIFVVLLVSFFKSGS